MSMRDSKTQKETSAETPKKSLGMCLSIAIMQMQTQMHISLSDIWLALQKEAI